MPLSFYGSLFSFFLIEANFIADSKVLHFIAAYLRSMARGGCACQVNLFTCWPNRVQPGNELNLANQDTNKSCLPVCPVPGNTTERSAGLPEGQHHPKPSVVSPAPQQVVVFTVQTCNCQQE